MWAAGLERVLVLASAGELVEVWGLVLGLVWAAVWGVVWVEVWDAVWAEALGAGSGGEWVVASEQGWVAVRALGPGLVLV